MILNVLQTVKDMKGIELTEGENKVFLRRFLVDSLGANFEDERNLDGNEKYKRGKLAFYIENNDEVTLTVEDVALLKKLVGKGYSAKIVFRIWDMLEGNQ